mgnify:CR=1 FL=1
MNTYSNAVSGCVNIDKNYQPTEEDYERWSAEWDSKVAEEERQEGLRILAIEEGEYYDDGYCD